MKNTSWQIPSGHYRSLYCQHLLLVDVPDEDFLADTNYSTSARSRQQMLSAWFRQTLNPFLLRHSYTTMCIFFAQLCMHSDRALIQQPNGQEQSFSAAQFSGRPDAFYRHTCCSGLQKEGKTKMISWIAFPKTTEDEEGTAWSVFLRSGGWNPWHQFEKKKKKGGFLSSYSL